MPDISFPKFQEMVTPTFTAEKWLSCVLPIFKATILPTTSDRSLLTHAEMSATKVWFSFIY